MFSNFFSICDELQSVVFSQIEPVYKMAGGINLRSTLSKYK